MIAKLTDGVLTFAPGKITFANPPEQLLKDYAGFKDYIENEKPEYNPDTQILKAVYSENETQIICSWQIEDIETESEPYTPDSERISNLETEVNGIAHAIREGLS